MNNAALPHLIPLPKNFELKSGNLVLNDFLLTCQNISPDSIRPWLAYLRKQFTRLGVCLKADLLSDRTEPVFTLRQNGCVFLNLALTDSGIADDEQYRLEVTQQGISLDSGSAAGIVHGLQTLLQLVWWSLQPQQQNPCPASQSTTHRNSPGADCIWTSAGISSMWKK
jgi:hypothetical protein